MPSWRYEFTTDDRDHVLTADWNYLSGKQTVRIGNKTLFDKVNWKLTHPIRVPLKGHQATLTLKLAMLVSPTATLVVDGEEIEPAEGSSSGPPAWAWLFAVPCFAMPIVTLGGAIPGAIGFGAGGACIGVAGHAELPVAARVLICTVIVAAAWGGLIAVVGGVAALQR